MNFLVSIVLTLTVLSRDAHAYLDPGTGSYVLQMVIASIVSAFFAIKMFWRKIVDFLLGLFRGKK